MTVLLVNKPSPKSSSASDTRNDPLTVMLALSRFGIRPTKELLSKVQYGAPFAVFVGFLNILMSAHLFCAASGLPYPAPGELPNPVTLVPCCHFPLTIEPGLKKPSMLPWPVAPATMYGKTLPVLENSRSLANRAASFSSETEAVTL